MAETKMFPINQDFNMNDLVGKLTQMYQAQGFDVVPRQMGEAISIKFSKDEDGIKKFVGLGLEITANLTVNDNSLMIAFDDEEWVGKLIGIGVGLILCWIPAFVAGYGAYKQSEFPKKIANDIQVLLSDGTMPFKK